MESALFLTDSYKVSHYKQYPPGTESVYSYFESRGGAFAEVVFFGLQSIICGDIWRVCRSREPISTRPTSFMHGILAIACSIARAGNISSSAHGGRLPVVTGKAVPEGTVVPVSNVLMTIENTDPRCYWLTNWLETLLVQVWYGSTVATQSREMKKVLLRYLHETGNPTLIDFKLHDFGFFAVGVSSVETAAVGCAAHLINFRGTDTVVGLVMARDYYGCAMAGQSIPAAEHSTITSWGREHEVDAYANMLDQYPDGLVAVVSDSYDIFRACSELWGRQLKDKVLARNGVLVVRPDSGDPPETVCRVLDLLGEAFGTTTNAQGFKVLDPHVRVIQGDGIDYAMLGTILAAMKARGWSADNVAFGSGGGLLQKLNRDTLKFAFKCSSIHIDGRDRDVFKQPITDNGKRSKAGRLKLIRRDGRLMTVPESTEGADELRVVFRDGEVIEPTTLEEVRGRAEVQS